MASWSRFSAIGGYAWLAIVGTLVAYVLWFQGVGRLPVAAVSFLVLLSPVVATALGWLVLDQPLTAWQTVGFVLAMVSILGAQLTPDAARGLLRPPRGRAVPQPVDPMTKAPRP